MIRWADRGERHTGRRSRRSRSRAKIGVRQIAAGNQRYGSKDPDAYPMGAFISARRVIDSTLRLGIVLDSFPKYPKGKVGPCLTHDFLFFRAVLVADNEAGEQWQAGVLQHNLGFRVWFDRRRGEIRSRLCDNQYLSQRGSKCLCSQVEQDVFPAVVFQVDTVGAGVVEVSTQAQLKDGRGATLVKSPAVRRLVSYQLGAHPGIGPELTDPPRLDVSAAW